VPRNGPELAGFSGNCLEGILRQKATNLPPEYSLERDARKSGARPTLPAFPNAEKSRRACGLIAAPCIGNITIGIDSSFS
jgi:hypothetical protein